MNDYKKNILFVCTSIFLASVGFCESSEENPDNIPEIKNSFDKVEKFRKNGDRDGDCQKPSALDYQFWYYEYKERQDPKETTPSKSTRR